MPFLSVISATQPSTHQETKPFTGPSKASTRSLTWRRPLTPKSRCMFDNKPTRAAMILLEGCVSYIRNNNLGFIVVTNSNGDKKYARSKQDITLNILRSFRLTSRIAIRKKMTPYYMLRNEIPENQIRSFTSVKGVRLLREWAKRDNFKPFFDAYAGHITDDMLDAQAVLLKMEGNWNMIPIWIKGRESMQPREDTESGDFQITF